MSERITWITCPCCGRRAAVGWDGDDPVEFDCPAGCRCRLIDEQLQALTG